MSANLHAGTAPAAGHAPVHPKHHPAISREQLAAVRSASMFLAAQDAVRLPDGMPAALPLADRAVRLAAAFVDALVTFAVTFSLCSILSGQTPEMLTPGFAGSCVVIFWALNGWTLARRGQTLGKSMMHIKIVTLGDQRPGIGRLFFARFLTAVVLLPVSPFFIFRADRRCLHDLAAGTKVVETTPTPLPGKV